MRAIVSRLLHSHTKILLIFILVVNIVYISVSLIGTSKAEHSQQPADSVPAAPAEITGIIATKNTKFQAGLYKKLIERVGPAQAQEDLYHSGLPLMVIPICLTMSLATGFTINIKNRV